MRSAMPRQNRVTPFGELIATPERGAVYGNRGCLHDDEGRIRRGWNGRRWISCRLAFKGWQRGPLLQPGRFTELFFLDEATAFAAGHRPCALCRREDYDRFLAAWRALHPGDGGADVLDLRLHGERVQPGTRNRLLHEEPFETLPDGVHVVVEGEAHLVCGGRIRLWSPGGYRETRQHRSARAMVLTPPSTVEVLRQGWEPLVPFIHPSAHASHDRSR